MTFRREASVIHDYILFVHNGQSNILEHRCKWHVITILGWAFSSSCTTVEWRETNTHTQIETLTYLWLLLIWNLIQNRRKIGRITISSWMLRCFNVIPDYFSHFFLTLALWNIIPIQSFLGRKKRPIHHTSYTCNIEQRHKNNHTIRKQKMTSYWKIITSKQNA